MGQDFISSALLNVNEPDLTQAKGAEFVQRWVFYARTRTYSVLGHLGLKRIVGGDSTERQRTGELRRKYTIVNLRLHICRTTKHRV